MFDVSVSGAGKRVYLRRYDTREEASAAGVLYVQTGEKPKRLPRHKRVSTGPLPDRPMVRVSSTDGPPAFDAFVLKGLTRIYLRRYDTHQEALDASLKYLRTGIKPTPLRAMMNRTPSNSAGGTRPRAVPNGTKKSTVKRHTQERKTRGESTIIVPRAPAPVNPWQARYGKGGGF